MKTITIYLKGELGGPAYPVVKVHRAAPTLKKFAEGHGYLNTEVLLAPMTEGGPGLAEEIVEAVAKALGVRIAIKED